jgi:hypothetical protein
MNVVITILAHGVSVEFPEDGVYDPEQHPLRLHEESGFEDFDSVDWSDPEVRAQLWADSRVLVEAINSGLLDAVTAAEIQVGLR